MRSLVFAVSVAFAVTCFPAVSSGAQHAGGGPGAGAAMAAPAVHAAPMHSAPASVGAPGAIHSAPHLGAHPVTHTHTSPARLSTRTSPNSPVAHTPRSAWVNGLPPNSIAPVPSSLAFVNSVPRLLPSSSFFEHHHRGDHFRTGGVILPWGDFGGFYYPVPYYEPADNQGDEAAANDSDNSGQNDNGNGQIAVGQPTAPAAAPYYPPSEPVYDFVFVKRDGTKIFAVAYSLTKDNLQYVTKEGLRRTVPLDALDFDATQKSNEERGNTVNLPPPPPSAIAAL